MSRMLIGELIVSLNGVLSSGDNSVKNLAEESITLVSLTCLEEFWTPVHYQKYSFAFESTLFLLDKADAYQDITSAARHILLPF